MAKEKGKGNRNKRTSKKWKMYEVKDGRIIRRHRYCPRCGPGVFMADHGNRYSCGRCGYTEWKRHGR